LRCLKINGRHAANKGLSEKIVSLKASRILD
jgi:hypothetical protein